MLVQVLVEPEISLWSKPQSETRAGMCVQAAGQAGQVPLQQHPWVSCQGVQGESGLKAMGRCVLEPGGVSWAPSCLGISAPSCACHSGGTLPIP